MEGERVPRLKRRGARARKVGMLKLSGNLKERRLRWGELT